jgi:RNA polymerase sigma-70 factor (ECF subfamily)
MVLSTTAVLMDDSSRELTLDQHFAGPPLLPLIAAGQVAAVDEFVERYGGLIWSMARKMMRVPQDAEDIVQEIFIELWKNAASFNPARGSEVTFVAIVTRRRLIDRLRRTSANVNVVELREHPVIEPVASGHNSLEVIDELDKVRNCMGQLTANAQSVLTLILQEGKSHQEASQTLCMPLGSVKSFARRGLLALRDCMKRPLAASLQEARS